MGKKIKNTFANLKQYTKQILTAVMVVWVAGAVSGIVYEFVRLAVAPDTASMDGLYVYLAVPLSCGLPSYIIPNLFLTREEVRSGRYYGEDTSGSDIELQ